MWHGTLSSNTLRNNNLVATKIESLDNTWYYENSLFLVVQPGSKAEARLFSSKNLQCRKLNPLQQASAQSITPHPLGTVKLKIGVRQNLLLVAEQLFHVVGDDGDLLGVEVGRASLLSLVAAVDAVEDDGTALLRQELPVGQRVDPSRVAHGEEFRFVEELGRQIEDGLVAPEVGQELRDAAIVELAAIFGI